MTEFSEPAPTEQELRDGNVKIKRALRWSAVFYTPIVVALLWYLAGEWWWAIAAAFVIGEVVSYPQLAKMVDRNTEEQIALLHAQQADPQPFPTDR